jgi:hypothetical protein
MGPGGPKDQPNSENWWKIKGKRKKIQAYLHETP